MQPIIMSGCRSRNYFFDDDSYGERQYSVDLLRISAWLSRSKAAMENCATPYFELLFLLHTLRSKIIVYLARLFLACKKYFCIIAGKLLGKCWEVTDFVFGNSPESDIVQGDYLSETFTTWHV